MNQRTFVGLLALSVLPAFAGGCQNPGPAAPGAPAPSTPTAAVAAGQAKGDPAYAKPGFVAFVDAGRLWVLRPGEKKSEKHITLVGAGPRGMTVKALDRKTALTYLATRPGFAVEVDDAGRLWVLRPGEKKSEKHITLVGAGPMGTTVKGLDREVLKAWQAAR